MPIYKNYDKTDLGNYRPVSVFWYLSKVWKTMGLDKTTLNDLRVI